MKLTAAEGKRARDSGAKKSLKVKLLPSSFELDGSSSARQHLSCLVINDHVAVDAGSLAMAATSDLRRTLRDVVLTHAHLDHIAGLPLFIDDLFVSLDRPVTVHALKEVIDILERDIFNWSIFPRFSELSTRAGCPIVYHPIGFGCEFRIAELAFAAFESAHKVPSAGYLVSQGNSTVAISGDTANLESLAQIASQRKDIEAIIVECAFPNELEAIAQTSHHMTPAVLDDQLKRMDLRFPVLVMNIKPNYRSQVVEELVKLKIPELEIMEVGRDYFW